MKKNLGQYFTTNYKLKEKVFEFILNSPLTILEPSIGQGDLVQYIQSKNPTVHFDMYEIDDTIPLLNPIEKDKVIYGDFIQQSITKKYTTIVGNPPYVRTKKGNLYIDFVEKCYRLLEENGELVFIVPSDFFKLTSASKLLNEMFHHGTYSHIYHPHNENMFADASIDIILFRYVKKKDTAKTTLYNNRVLYIANNNGLITFETENHTNDALISDYFDVYVGLVTGKEEVYKNEELGNITVLNGENKYDKYIYIEKYPCEKAEINHYLLEHKQELMERGIKKFNEENWFEWGAPRNITTIRNNMGKDCIYVYNLTRKREVAFVGKVGYFGGGLIMLIPKKECDLYSVVSYINSSEFKEKFVFSGRFKIGHRQICNSYMHTVDAIDEIDLLTSKLDSITINEAEKNISNDSINTKINNPNTIDYIKKIQRWYRGNMWRIKRLPLIMYQIQKYLKNQSVEFSNQNEDGRINSCVDEDVVIKLLVEKFGNRIKKPKIRMWYDILVFDYRHGWLPTNIKTTTTLTSDNTGNLAMCVYAYTDEPLDIEKSYENGKMSTILFHKLQNKKYNKTHKKDYYFIVLNKTDGRDVIVNSVKGLTALTANINNLPFQICWNKNRVFQYGHIDSKVDLFIECLQKPKPSWKETFMANIRTIERISGCEAVGNRTNV